MTMTAVTAPLGVILAGGLGRRMGGADKALVPLGGRPLIAHVIDRLSPQVAELAINANGPAERFAAFGLPVLPDPLPDHPGPLAGVLAGLDWAAAAGADWIVTAPADTPFLPGDLVPRLMLAAEGRRMAVAATDRVHPVCGLWPVARRAALREAIAAGTRRLTDWTEAEGAGIAPFPATVPDAFFNVNTAGDMAQAEGWL